MRGADDQFRELVGVGVRVQALAREFQHRGVGDAFGDLPSRVALT